MGKTNQKQIKKYYGTYTESTSESETEMSEANASSLTENLEDNFDGANITEESFVLVNFSTRNYEKTKKVATVSRSPLYLTF